MQDGMMSKMMMAMMALILLIGVMYAAQGVRMHAQVPVEEARFNQLQGQYFSQAKAVRDAAETNSELSQQLVRLQQYPSQLLELKLVGVGRILTGIFVVLVGIMIALVMMPNRLKKAIRG
ncbi:MAG: hypothetical protein COU69_02875 [Candidatus Pacebacteria bacterium CG10_big_fil_rev_8_21_14_0_10_56_10]|nr:MAG: hypothetical protein COU69_02875 [Candidatus Pacebacteria bacterium CG10_big_fil_rev_8_21_14_0_10_56_10]